MTEGTVREADADVESLRARVRALEAEAAEHQRTRQRLREETAFREAVIQRAAEGLCVCHAIEEVPYVEFTVWNRRMAEITGYSMEEVNRRGWYQTVYTDPEVRERARARMAEMREGVDLLGEQWEITRADGARRTVSISTTLLRGEDGVAHALALMQDMTDEVAYRRGLESQVRRLEGLLPICASCKQIRDEEGRWHVLEEYISGHSAATFTHGICPDCASRLYPGLGRR